MPLAIQHFNSESPEGIYCLDRRDEAMTFQRAKVLRDLSVLSRSAYWENRAHFEAARRSLHRTAAIRSDWDTYGAEAPNSVARAIAADVLALLETASLPPSRLLPSAEGGIAMSFVAGRHRAELEIYNTGEIAAATYSGQNEPNVWALDATESSLKAGIEEIRVRLAA